MSRNRPSLSRQLAVAIYFFLTFEYSWTGAVCVALPRLLRHEPITQFGPAVSLLMLFGPSVIGVLMTSITEGREGLCLLYARMGRITVRPAWYFVLTTPAVLLLVVLLSLRNFWSPVFAPNDFWPGLSSALVAGWLEEIGWSGYVFPKMAAMHGGFVASVLLGAIWAIWHLPVIGYFAVAGHHGLSWVSFFLAFAAAMIGLRVLISWAYANTKSLLLVQIMLGLSMGSLVVLSPTAVSATQETTWYAVYAGALWVIVGLVAVVNSPWLALRHEQKYAVQKYALTMGVQMGMRKSDTTNAEPSGGIPHPSVTS